MPTIAPKIIAKKNPNVKRSGQFIDLTGKRFGKLTITKYYGSDGHHSWWEFKCDCGDTGYRSQNSLRAANASSIQSCRVCNIALVQSMAKASVTHGATVGRKIPQVYYVWQMMCRRCDSPSVESYPRYGGRGIRVCERMRTFVGFSEVMGERPDGMMIERVNNDGNYSCGTCDECQSGRWTMNVRWATPTEQGANKSTNRWIEHDGVRKTLIQWSRHLKMCKATLAQRLNKGWSVSDALFKPVGNNGPKAKS